jgi:hypothetical protein
MVILSFCYVVTVVYVTSCFGGHDWHFSNAVVDGVRFTIAC